VRWLRGLPAALLGTLLLAILLGAAPASAPPAAAEEPEAFVSIRLDRVEPALPARNGEVTITSKVTNTSEGLVSNLQAYFWRSLDPITDSEGMSSALESAANEPLGARKGDFENLPSNDDRDLEPGESTRFSVSVAVADLELPRGDGVFLMGVQVRGRTVDNGPQFTLGRARVFVPLVETPPERSLQLTSVVVLTSRPALLSTPNPTDKGLLVDDHLAEEVADGGRLRALLAAADRADVSFAVDPALVETLAAMTPGYEVLGDEQRREPGKGAADAARWLDDFAKLLGSRDGYRLLYSSVDAAGLVRGGQSAVLGRAAAAGRAVPATRSLPLLALPPGGAADAATVSALAALNPAAIVLSDASVRTAGPVLEGPTDVPIVRYTRAASGGGPGPDPRDTPVHLRQRLLADTWVQVSTAEPGRTVGRVRVITSADEARSDSGAITGPWTTRSTLAALLRTTPARWHARYRYTAADQELTSGQLRAVDRLSRSWTTYSELLVSPRQARLDQDTAVARAASGSYRRSAKAGRRLVTAQQNQLDQALTDQITISLTRRVVTSARSGFFPVTIRNGLPADPSDPAANAVRGRLVFTSANSQRLTVAPIDVDLLRAGQNLPANGQVEAESNGTVRVTAQLETLAGTKVGTPVTFDVRATRAGATGWLIAVVAGLVLVGTTALRIRQVARERSGTAGLPAGDDPGPLTSAPPVHEDPSGSGNGTGPGRTPERLDV
jgi:hypothetical protein